MVQYFDTSAPAPLLAPNRPPLLAVLLPKRPLADDATAPAAAGAPIGTIRRYQESILSEKTNLTIKICYLLQRGLRQL